MVRAMVRCSWINRSWLALLAAAVLVEGVLAQDDLRDRVTRKGGAVLRCRVFARYGEDAVTVQIGRHREQVPRADVVAMDTVRDRVREFFRLLARLPDNA